MTTSVAPMTARPTPAEMFDGAIYLRGGREAKDIRWRISAFAALFGREPHLTLGG